MPRGNMNLKNYSPMVDNTEIDKELNAVMVQNILESFYAPIPDLHKPEEVERAITAYFKRCIDKGLRPGNLGLYNAIGLDKKHVYDLLHGLTPKVASSQTVELIKKACKNLSEFRESLGSQGKLNPATLIFWQKNFDGLEDVQRMEVTAQTQENAELSPDEIANKIESDIPVDVPYKETE